MPKGKIDTNNSPPFSQFPCFPRNFSPSHFGGFVLEWFTWGLRPPGLCFMYGFMFWPVRVSAPNHTISVLVFWVLGVWYSYPQEECGCIHRTLFWLFFFLQSYIFRWKPIFYKAHKKWARCVFFIPMKLLKDSDRLLEEILVETFSEWFLPFVHFITMTVYRLNLSDSVNSNFVLWFLMIVLRFASCAVAVTR